jgi:hypothetical protein
MLVQNLHSKSHATVVSLGWNLEGVVFIFVDGLCVYVV